MSSAPLVSVLINNFNYGCFLRDAIDSVLIQTYPRVEVVVVDDGSTDDSREVLATYGNRIRVILKENGGQSSAFNAGYAASTGEIICLLDSDDVFLPYKVEKVVQCFAELPNIGWCYHALEYCDRSLDNLLKVAPHGIPSTPVDARNLLQKSGNVPTGVFPATSGLCFRRECLSVLLPMPTLKILADNYVKVVAAALFPGYWNSNAWAKLRLHGANSYTDRDDAASKKALHNMNIALAIRNNFAHLRRLSAKMFTANYARLLLSDLEQSERTRIFEQVLKTCTIYERAELVIGVGYHRLRALAKSWMRVT